MKVVGIIGLLFIMAVKSKLTVKGVLYGDSILWEPENKILMSNLDLGISPEYQFIDLDKADYYLQAFRGFWSGF